MEVGKHHEAALKTYEILQKRKAKRKQRAEQQYLDHVAENMDRVYKRGHHGRKRRGQL